MVWTAVFAALFAAASVASVTLWRRERSLRVEVARWHRIADRRVESVAEVSHELRTPLALIKGPVELLLEETPGPLTTTQREFVTTVQRNAAHLSEITEDLLMQSRLEAGVFSYDEGAVDLRQLGLQAIEDVQSLYSVPVALDCPGRPPIVKGDARLLQQAVMNLLTNACRHSGSELIVLRIVQQSHHALVVVDDHGVGIGREGRAALFLRWNTSAPLSGGIGIGLGIAREIIRMHGAELHVRTSPNSGTTFMFALEI